MERHPIFTKDLPVKLVQAPLDINSMFPNYRYEFQDKKISEEAVHMYSELLDFMKTNEELILSESVASTEDYSKGFQKALAVTRLWIDSIYIKPSEE